MEIGHAAERLRQDRISKLDDAILAHVLSFLPSKQAARTAALSSRWRDAFAGVHTVSLEEPKGPAPTYNLDGRHMKPEPPPPFGPAITAAIVARHRQPATPPPLRALRVALQDYTYEDFVAVDQWVSYALKQAGPELELDLRLTCLPISCSREGADTSSSEEEDNTDDEDDDGGEDDDDDGDDEDSVSSEDERVPSPSPLLHRESFRNYTVPRGVFLCSTLRTLRIGPCRLSTPSDVSLPSLQELLLTRVSDDDESVQRLISACPRLADLTLESCSRVSALSLLDTRLRRLALRCCHNLSHVGIDVSELGSFEYRGAVPEMPFLATLGTPGWFVSMPSLASCTVYICGGEVTSPDELARLTGFLQQFASTKHLRLRSKRLYPDIARDAVTGLLAFPNLHHLELRGHLPHDADVAAIVGATSRILRRAPNLEVLSFIFETGTGTDIHEDGPLPTGRYSCKAMELVKAHRLKYNRFSIVDWPASVGAMDISCLANRVREINLVHYQGGRAQRTLARFLLCNAPVVGELWCQFAEGPLWMQTELMREMKSWVMNEKANMIFR